MLYLTPIITEEQIEQSKPEVAKMSDRDKQQNLDAIEKLRTFPIRERITIDVGTAIDRDGNTYEDISLLANLRFKKDGVTYLSNGTVAVNFDAMSELVKEMLATD